MDDILKPFIHYDHVMGSSPAWREAVTLALQGDKGIIQYAIGKLHNGGHMASAKLLAACYLYAYWGQQVYCVGPQLQGLLSETNLSKVPPAFLKLPYDCIYVALPDSPWKIWGGPRTRWHDIAGVYISSDGEKYTFLLWGKENKRSERVGDDATFWLCLDTKGAPTSGEDLVDLDQWFNSTTILHGIGNESEITVSKGIHTQGKDAARAVFRVCINLILYLNSADPEQTVISNGGPIDPKKRMRLRRQVKTGGKKGKKARSRLKAMTEARIVWIGKTIETAKPRTGAPRTASVRHPHWRKGHFHAYWVGSKKDAEGNARKGEKQVLKWLPPVFVGNMAEMIRARGTIHKFREDQT